MSDAARRVGRRVRFKSSELATRGLRRVGDRIIEGKESRICGEQLALQANGPTFVSTAGEITKLARKTSRAG